MRTTIDAATGDLLVAGKRVFPLGLSDPPPLGSRAPDGTPAWTAVARAGVNYARNYTVWTATGFGEQLLAVADQLDAAERAGMQLWLALAGVDESPARGALRERIVNTVKDHPGLGVWKGADEPALGRVPAAGLVAVHAELRALDPDHPLVIIEAPRAPGAAGTGRTRPLTAAAVRPYAAACDIHGVDIYPVAGTPGAHAGGPPVNTDISVVGDVTAILARASGGKPVWTTLQIAWSGVLPPNHRLVFPTLQQARFMAYDAIIAGARGLFFFGGHLKAAMSAADRRRGWNWSYWQRVQQPLLRELGDRAHTAALLAPAAPKPVRASAADIAVSARQQSGVYYLLAVRRSARTHGKVRFSGLPAAAAEGRVLAHPGGNPARPVRAAGGSFTDPAPFAPHNARVYRFPLH